MNTEPPQGDDLQQMLVSMKRNVLARAELDRPAPKRRGRRAGIVIGVIAVLGIGVGSGAVALGMVPQPFTAAPAPTPTRQAPSVTPTPSSAPVVEEPSSTPTPTPTRAPFDAADPSTWTISGNEVGPVALGGETDAESDDLHAAYDPVPAPDGSCTPPGTWERDGSAQILVASQDGRVSGVLVSSPIDTTPTSPWPGPTTAAGIGVGSSLAELRAAYSDLARSSDLTGEWSTWQTDVADGTIRFQLGEDGDHVRSVWVSADQNRPTAKCDV